MCPPYRSVTPGVVREVTLRHLTDTLPWAHTRTVPADLLVRALLLVATGVTSLFAVVRRRFIFPHHAADRAVRAKTASPAAVADGLNRTLHPVLRLSRLDRSRPCGVALDTHPIPDDGRRTRDVVGGPRKTGTNHVHGSATAALVTPGDRPPELVGRLLDRIAAARGRFGIATTYRQKNQARGFTTSPGDRLRLEGLAHLIRQVWVLPTERIAGHRPSGWVQQLSLATRIEWLADALRDGLQEAREIPVPRATRG